MINVIIFIKTSKAVHGSACWVAGWGSTSFMGSSPTGNDLLYSLPVAAY